ncbi:MAG: hypothetical protein JXB15_16840 [Anaerolineales bacterium]|nr:hypothetical protein [Anaerolineales bacterium]
MKIKLLFSLLLVCSLLLASSAWAAPAPTTLLWNVLGGGGGQVSSGTVVVEGSIGQPVTGPVSQGAASVCSGYWCGAGDIYLPDRVVYLPVVIRH